MHIPYRVKQVWSLLCLLPFVTTAGRAEQTPPLAIRAILPTNVFVIGEPIPVVVEVTNRSRAQVGFTWQAASDTSSGASIEMTHLESQSQLKFLGQMGGCAEGWINPGGTWVERLDLAKTFRVEEPGHYGLRVRYQEYSTEIVLDASGNETSSRIRKAMDIQSELAQIIVTLPDPNAVRKIDSLLRSGKDEDIEQGIHLLAAAGIGVYRKELPALWSVVRTRQQPVRNQALRLFLSRIDLADERVSDDEMFSELAVASTDQDPSLRVAVAESLSRLHALGARRQALNRFVAQKVPKWFDSETSPACRALLVRCLPVPKSDRLVAIIQHDADPQVRAAAIQRLIELDPHRFLESAETFTNLTGEVTVEGRRLSLGLLVEREKDKVRRTLRTDDDRDSTPSPK